MMRRVRHEDEELAVAIEESSAAGEPPALLAGATPTQRGAWKQPPGSAGGSPAALARRVARTSQFDPIRSRRQAVTAAVARAGRCAAFRHDDEELAVAYRGFRSADAGGSLAGAAVRLHDAGVQEQPFTPDEDYCAYCHAPAAGVCADCGALCCGDCVELVLRFTSQRAVCRSCLRDAPPARPRWRWVMVAVAAIAAAVLLWLRAGA
jgi:hypothetical protein